MGNTQTPSYFADSASSRTGVIDAPQEVAPNTDIELAKHYIKLGWSLIPLKARSKEPVGAWKQYQKTPADSQTVLEWLKKGYGLGVVLGEVSDNWVCRDFDEVSSYRAWAAANPILRDTLPTSRTGRGFHVFAKLTANCKTEKFDDGELRSERVYVAIPPSMHPDVEGAYKWVREPAIDTAALDLSQTGFDRSWSVPEIPEIPEIPETPETPEEHIMASGVSGSLVQVEHVSVDQEHEIEAAIKQTVPYKVGGRNDGIWKFARRVIAILDGRPTIDLAEKLALRWCASASPTIGTLDPNITIADFYHAIGNVKVPDTGENLVDQAFRRCKDLPIPWWVETTAAPNENAVSVLLAKLVVSMDEMVGGDVWYLSSHLAGKLMGTTHTPILRLLYHWERKKVLRITEHGHPGRPGSKANRYQLIQHERPL